jgi:hypothetical protein
MESIQLTNQKTKRRSSWHLTRYAFHEAGHAVAGHAIGRYIAEVSIRSETGRGYRGYCAFDAFVESMNNRLQWQKGSHNPDLITILYAGTLAMSVICDHYGWKYEHWRGCDKADFDTIYRLSLEMFPDDEQRQAVQKVCRSQAWDILTRHWSAVTLLASHLLEQGRITGGEAHKIIRQAIGEKDDDWRLKAWDC